MTCMNAYMLTISQARQVVSQGVRYFASLNFKVSWLRTVTNRLDPLSSFRPAEQHLTNQPLIEIRRQIAMVWVWLSAWIVPRRTYQGDLCQSRSAALSVSFLNGLSKMSPYWSALNFRKFWVSVITTESYVFHGSSRSNRERFCLRVTDWWLVIGDITNAIWHIVPAAETV